MVDSVVNAGRFGLCMIVTSQWAVTFTSPPSLCRLNAEPGTTKFCRKLKPKFVTEVIHVMLHVEYIYIYHSCGLRLIVH